MVGSIISILEFAVIIFLLLVMYQKIKEREVQEVRVKENKPVFDNRGKFSMDGYEIKDSGDYMDLVELRVSTCRYCRGDEEKVLKAQKEYQERVKDQEQKIKDILKRVCGEIHELLEEEHGLNDTKTLESETE